MKKSSKKKSLVIVESPAKVKTLSKILGDNFEIKASYGHIRDLPKKGFGINIKKDFKPKYQLMESRDKVISELRSSLAEVDKVYLATDPDREGEAIAWHLMEGLELAPERVERVTFNEITPQAVLDAFKKTRQISMSLVNAQQARRFLDRIVGYKLSPLLWRKVARGLSAGRVQSVAVRLLVEREKEIGDFKPQEYWKISGDFKIKEDDEKPFEAALYKIDDKQVGSPSDDSTEVFIPNEANARNLVSALEATDFKVANIRERENNQQPPPPFITSTLQQQASTQMGFSTKKTMIVAQQLYEGVDIEGEPVALITYMRTDAVRVSEIAIKECRDFISKKYGKSEVFKTPRHYKSRKGAQDAHEAIRPTYVSQMPSEIKGYLTPEQYKLYNLIWKRFVATQMKPGHWRNKTIEIEAALKKPLPLDVNIISGEAQPTADKMDVNKCVFRVDERRLVSKGFLALYEPEEQLLPEMKGGEKVLLMKLFPAANFTQPSPRYNEASLVKALEKFGIGRPSTYAPIISTIQDRGYVQKAGRQLVATELGILVTEKLIPYFTDILNTKFTSQMEKRLDAIEEERSDWISLLKAFYRLFKRDLEKATLEMASSKGKESATGEKCDKCGKPLVERWGRFGKFLACSGYPECKNIVSLKPKVETQSTGEVCEKCGKPMVIKRSRKGWRFMACSGYPECKTTKSLKKQAEPAVEPEKETIGE
ncbi:MAG: type I DNA topoisomerase [Planctomycetes bacterium]|nr:type I DNA topoisomerase [Planctomycetota bacterium]